MDPIVIDPPNFDQKAAWGECADYVDKCGGLDESNPRQMQAAAGADPGCCSCPQCGKTYWAWGRRQKCRECHFEYPTDWWPMFSWGCTAARTSSRYEQKERMKHPYYRLGFESAFEDPWATTKLPEWRASISAAVLAMAERRGK